MISIRLSCIVAQFCKHLCESYRYIYFYHRIADTVILALDQDDAHMAGP